ncbi:tripartite motif-containing protein 2-like isoform X3 [Pomacea canaliculata]|uniref:tripartite motif-containing protein 2-like isoform X3 n=1 Tax=Pomacea canaliculata TaxID=400727 RepID=UPI000D73DD4C|nr:tripartite motif-containing protein 2-like isoform X3 [Pomacea canaliculata]
MEAAPVVNSNPDETESKEQVKRWLEKSLSLSCALCLEVYRTPKLLPCSHTFCEECLEKLIDFYPERVFPCPSCRQEIEVPFIGVAGFKANFYLDPAELDKVRRQCWLHDDQEVTAFCTTCDLGVCTQCLCTTHENHSIVDLGEKELTEKKTMAFEHSSNAVLSKPRWWSLAMPMGKLWTSLSRPVAACRSYGNLFWPRTSRVTRVRRRPVKRAKRWLVFGDAKRLFRQMSLSLRARAMHFFRQMMYLRKRPVVLTPD